MSTMKIVEQLRQLSAVEGNRAAIIRDNGSVPALLLFLDNNDQKVVKTSLEALEYLSLCVPLRPELGREFGLKMSLEKIINGADRTNAAIADRVTKNLYGTPKPSQPTQSKPVLGASSLAGFSSVRPLSATEPSKVLFASQALKQNNKTIILRVVISHGNVRTLVEDALLSVRGVVSFTFDTESSRFTVRAKKEVEVEMLFDAILDSDDSIDVCQVVKGADGKESMVSPWRGDEDDNEYDDENDAPKANIAAQGAGKKGAKQSSARDGNEDEDDGYWDEEEDEEVKRKSAVTLQGHDFEKDDKRVGSSGWFGGIGSYISKSIWG